MLADPEIYERVFSKVYFEPSCGCWIWAGGTCRDYGLIKIDGRMIRVHHLTFEHFNGPIPDGMELDHTCRLRCCINPGHLEAVTRRVNILRALPYRVKKYKPRCLPESPRLVAAIKAAGSMTALAKGIGISAAAVSVWKEIPVDRVPAISKFTGIPRADLRPDIWGP